MNKNIIMLIILSTFSIMTTVIISNRNDELRKQLEESDIHNIPQEHDSIRIEYWNKGIKVRVSTRITNTI